MKQTLTSLLSLVLLLATASALAQDILWEKSYGGKHAEYLMDAQPTADFGFILAGSSLSVKSGNKTENNRGDLDYWIWKIDENGDPEWQKTLGGDSADFLQSIALTNDGGFILAGVSSSNTGFDKKDDTHGLDDFWVVKLNAKGAEEWQVTLGGEGQEKLHNIQPTRDGGYILGGTSSSHKSGNKTEDSFGGLDYWIVKLDSKGKLIWQKTFGGKYADELRSLTPTADGGYLVGGYSNSPASGNKRQDNVGEGDYWIIKLDAIGTEEWQKVLGGTGDDQLYVVHQTYDYGYVLAGNSNSSSGESKSVGNQDGTDFWVVKLDTSGEVVWQQTYNFGKTDILTSLIENEDHTLLIGGFAKGEFTTSKLKGKTLKQVQAKAKKGTDDYIVLKINEKGDAIWDTSVGSQGEDILKKALETRDGGYLLTGTSNAKPSGDKKTQQGSNDFWVVKLKDKDKPKDVKLAIEAYPNPTTQFTNVIVGYDFKEGTATVVDMAGRQLQRFEITSRTVPIDLSGLPEGIYIVNIKTDVQSDGVKIMKTLSKN